MAPLIEVDQSAFADAFGDRSIVVRHHLVAHPLFSFEAIAALADRLPPHAVRRERGDLPLDNRGYVDTGIGPPSDAVRDIARNGSRVSLREIQDDAEYRGLITRCHDEIAPLVGDGEGGVVRRSAYIFVTSPGSTTPMHFDPEHSLLLQIRGSKRVCSAPMSDARVAQRELDHYFDGRPCSLDTLASTCDEFVIGPGEGVYLPSFVAHWVEQTGDDVSVSFSLPFYTQYCERADQVHRVNKRLRRLHLAPRPPGTSVAVDRAKVSLLRSWNRMRRSSADAAR